MDAAELAIHTENTIAFIAVKATSVVLIPKEVRVRTLGGGWKDQNAAPRVAQNFRIIELGMTSAPPVVKLQDGTEREMEFWLLGSPAALVAIGDSWAMDGREWEVGEIIRSNQYEVRAVVAERGR